MSASKEHDLIVAMVARYVRHRGYRLVALDCSLDWLFGRSFRLPPSIVLHRPDVLGVRKEPPYVCIGEAKTLNDIRSARTRDQLRDFTEVTIGETGIGCEVVVGIPDDCKQVLGQVLSSLRIPPERIQIVLVPRPLLPGGGRA